MTYIASDVEAALVRNIAPDEDTEYGAPNYVWGEYQWGSTKPFVVDGIDGTIEVVDTAGGEGQGDHAHIVFKVVTVDGDEQYFKIDGYYSSYDGTDWDGSDLFEVRPIERTVVFYE